MGPFCTPIPGPFSAPIDTLHKDHDWLEAPAVINRSLARHFGGLDAVASHVVGDESYLAARALKAAERQKADAEYAASITYAADVGHMPRIRVEISPDGFRWKDMHIPLAAICRLRWGATQHSVNGISTGTTFTISVGDEATMAVVSLGDKAVYEALVDRLWRAAGVRLLFQYLNRLKASGALIFADFAIREDGVVVSRHRAFRASEAVSIPWSQVTVWSRDGSFFIGQKGTKKTFSQLGYQTHDNVAVVEHLIRMFFKSDKTRPSQLLD